MTACARVELVFYPQRIVAGKLGGFGAAAFVLAVEQSLLQFRKHRTRIPALPVEQDALLVGERLRCLLVACHGGPEPRISLRFCHDTGCPG